MKNIRTLLAFFVLITLLVSCALIPDALIFGSPDVFARVSFQISPDIHFYVIGSPRFGILNFIEEHIQNQGFTAEIVMDKRDIPEPARDSRTRHYMIFHEYDLVSENSGRRGPRYGRNVTSNSLNTMTTVEETWRLNIRIVEFDPRGFDRQVAIATSTANLFTAKELVDAVLAEIFMQAN
jgi:hypothetical protein